MKCPKICLQMRLCPTPRWGNLLRFLSDMGAWDHGRVRSWAGGHEPKKAENQCRLTATSQWSHAQSNSTSGQRRCRACNCNDIVDILALCADKTREVLHEQLTNWLPFHPCSLSSLTLTATENEARGRSSTHSVRRVEWRCAFRDIE